MCRYIFYDVDLSKVCVETYFMMLMENRCKIVYDDDGMIIINILYVMMDDNNKYVSFILQLLDKKQYWFNMERIKKNIKGLVKEFTADDVEMLDTTGTVLQFKDDVPSSTVKWICHLIEKPSMCFRNLYYVHF